MTLLQGRALVHLAGIIPNAAGTLHAFWAIFGALEDIVFLLEMGWHFVGFSWESPF
jgi:hypothetical protein